MDKQQQLDLLTTDTDKWNQWREQNPDITPNLAGQIISDVDLTGINLKGANLSEVSFIDVVLSHAKFDGANLSKAKFQSVNIKVVNFKVVKSKIAKGRVSFDGADLSESKFSEVKLDKSTFINAKLDSAQLGEHFKPNVKLSACDFTGASFKKAALIHVNLNNSNLTKVNLEEATLNYVSLSNINIGKAALINTLFTSVKFSKRDDLRHLNFSSCRFRDIDFSDANLSGTNFSSTNLNNVDFSNSQINYCNFSKSVISGSKFDGSNAENSNFTDSKFNNGREASSLREVSLKSSDFSNSDLSKCILIGSNLKQCNFRNANLRNTELSGITYGRRKSTYKGIMLEGSLGNIRFVEFSNNQSYLEELKVTNPLVYYFWLITCDCGRSLILWMFWSALAAIFFGLKYFSLGSESFELNHLPWEKSSMIYYSVVTFTTLGFGDILPKNMEAARWVMAEVITGYIMLGGLITIFASKIARRMK